MAVDIDNVRQWIGAIVSVAPVGSTLPTDTTTALDAAFEDLGVLSEADGAKESRSSTTNEYYGYGIGLVRSSISKPKFSVTITAAEDTPVVSGLVNFGGTQSTTGGVTKRLIKAGGVDQRALVLERSDGDIIKRLVLPKVQLVTVGDVASTEEKPADYALTFDAYNVTVDGELVPGFELTDDPGAVVS